MLAMIKSCVAYGMNGLPVTVEVDVGAGLAAFEIVGLPDAAVRESRERVRSALKNSGFEFPIRRITVNLAPADVKKEGPYLDLPIAVGILVATGQIPISEQLAAAAFVGELSLEGSLRPVSGSLAIADRMKGEPGVADLYLPSDNAAEAAISGGVRALGVDHLAQLVAVLAGEAEIAAATVDIEQLLAAPPLAGQLDMNEVRGQQAVKRALEIAAAGGHNLLMLRYITQYHII